MTRFGHSGEFLGAVVRYTIECPAGVIVCEQPFTGRDELHAPGDKVDASLKSEIEAAIAEAKAAVEGGDATAMSEKAQALAQVAMKLGQAIYEKQQQAEASPAADGAAAGSEAGGEEVVDAEFSEVDDSQKA